jgi:hypothetical protein
MSARNRSEIFVCPVPVAANPRFIKELVKNTTSTIPPQFALKYFCFALVGTALALPASIPSASKERIVYGRGPLALVMAFSSCPSIVKNTRPLPQGREIAMG